MRRGMRSCGMRMVVNPLVIERDCKDKELGMGKVNFCILMQTGTRTTG